MTESTSQFTSDDVGGYDGADVVATACRVVHKNCLICPEAETFSTLLNKSILAEEITRGMLFKATYRINQNEVHVRPFGSGSFAPVKTSSGEYGALLIP